MPFAKLSNCREDIVALLIAERYRRSLSLSSPKCCHRFANARARKSVQRGNDKTFSQLSATHEAGGIRPAIMNHEGSNEWVTDVVGDGMRWVLAASHSWAPVRGQGIGERGCAGRDAWRKSANASIRGAPAGWETTVSTSSGDGEYASRPSRPANKHPPQPKENSRALSKTRQVVVDADAIVFFAAAITRGFDAGSKRNYGLWQQKKTFTLVRVARDAVPRPFLRHAKSIPVKVLRVL